MPAPTEAARSPMPPGYEFLRVLGGGGCGWVALARQSALDRLVAIKTLYAGRYDEDERRRLEREGRALARLRDPRIVGVFAMEEIGEDVALVLEFVDGADLRHAMDEKTLSGDGFRRVLTDTAAALDLAASNGIVHRDVKPGNVLITRDGRAKLGDFGLARLAASAGAFRTAGAVVIGTPLYMAPEQIHDPEHEAPAGDAYSFAAMAYEVLLGRPPFEAADAIQLFWAHTSTIPPSPREVLPSISPEADAVLMAGLAKDPLVRPTPGQLMAMLNQHPEDWAHIVAEAPMPARPPEQALPASLSAGGGAAGGGAAGTPPVPPPAGVGSTASRSIQVPVGDVPWVQPPVYRPPEVARPRSRTPRVPPVLAGVVAALVVIVIVLLFVA